jgi:hypothetical protein
MNNSLLLTLLTVVVFVALLAATFLYRHNGRKQIFNIDLVQFVYLFVLTPMLFIWMKTFLFYLVRNELNLSVSVGELFTIDTVFSVVAFYVFAAVAIHSLTKTFALRRLEDPELDLYHLSEYFHLWWSHIVLYGGGMVLVAFISLTNLLITIPVQTSKLVFLGVPLLGVLFGVVSFISIWLGNPKQKHTNFLRIMKVLFALFFAIHAAAYILIRPSFNMTYGLFWFGFSIFLALGIFSVFVQRTKKADELISFFKHFGWEDNITLFESDEK